MRLKTTFSFLCLVLLLLSIGVLDIHANPCTSYLSDYRSKLEAFEAAREALARSRVATIKATPYATVPPEWKYLEDEYDEDTDGFFQQWKDGVSVHPNMPSYLQGLAGVINALGASSGVADLKQAQIKAKAAYDAAESAPIVPYLLNGWTGLLLNAKRR